MIIAIINATTAVILPIDTILASDAFLLKCDLYISIVKIVDVEFNIDANEETIAAASAASIRPLTPTGIKFLINQGAALSFAKFPAAPIKQDQLMKLLKILTHQYSLHMQLFRVIQQLQGLLV